MSATPRFAKSQTKPFDREHRGKADLRVAEIAHRVHQGFRVGVVHGCLIQKPPAPLVAFAAGCKPARRGQESGLLVVDAGIRPTHGDVLFQPADERIEARRANPVIARVSEVVRNVHVKISAIGLCAFADDGNARVVVAQIVGVPIEPLADFLKRESLAARLFHVEAGKSPHTLTT